MALQKTYITKPLEEARAWWIVDAKGLTLGRLAAQLAPILRGKHKPTFAPNHDIGDFIVVINCEKIVATGNKMEEKMYYRHSGYMGGLREETLRQVMQKYPDRALMLAVKGMLPTGSLGRNMLKKLKIYAGEAHPHAAQNPQVLALK